MTMRRFSTIVATAVITLATVVATSSAAGQSGTTTGSQSQTQTQTQQAAPQGQRNEEAARNELQQAKQALTDLIALPETSKLDAESRSAVNQIITSFNNLVTADSNWFERYQEVQRSLTPVIGPDPSDPTSSTGATSTAGTSGTAGTAGTAGTTTSGAAAATVDVPQPIKDKLVQFRQHMAAFAAAAGAPPPGSPAAAGGTAQDPASAGGASGEAMQPHFDAIGDLVQQALAGQSSAGTGTTGTSGTGTTGTGTSGTAAASGTVTVDRATLQEIQAHLQKLREIARAKGIR
jgi:hypothetical protein